MRLGCDVMEGCVEWRRRQCCDLIVDMGEDSEIRQIMDKILLAYCTQLELKIASLGKVFRSVTAISADIDI